MSLQVDIAIVGVQKAGTTSLLRWLGQHPAIQAQKSMELACFIDRSALPAGELAKILGNEFPDNGHQNPLHLLKHVGLFEDEQALRLLREHNPGVRLIAVLRQPADRAWSAFWYGRSRGYETETDFEKAAFGRTDRHFDAPFLRRSTDYLGRGFYEKNITALLRHFPKEQLLLLTFEDLKNEPQRVCDKVFEWLSLPSHPIALRAENTTRLPRYAWLSRLVYLAKPLKSLLPAWVHKTLKSKFKKVNKSTQALPEMPTPIRTRLNELYREANQRLYEQYGVDYR
ncbi:MAG: sulfotransferase domain-containing protein [Saprospiraceae bacterium]|nr:sulfotransferase domain-containing protein [Saprospiraceae bacterium]